MPLFQVFQWNRILSLTEELSEFPRYPHLQMWTILSRNGIDVHVIISFTLNLFSYYNPPCFFDINGLMPKSIAFIPYIFENNTKIRKLWIYEDFSLVLYVFTKIFFFFFTTVGLKNCLTQSKQF